MRLTQQEASKVIIKMLGTWDKIHHNFWKLKIDKPVLLEIDLLKWILSIIFFEVYQNDFPILVLSQSFTILTRWAKDGLKINIYLSSDKRRLFTRYSVINRCTLGDKLKEMTKMTKLLNKDSQFPLCAKFCRSKHNTKLSEAFLEKVSFNFPSRLFRTDREESISIVSKLTFNIFKQFCSKSNSTEQSRFQGRWFSHFAGMREEN